MNTMDAKVSVFNPRSISQAGRRGFESRLPLQQSSNKSIVCGQPAGRYLVHLRPYVFSLDRSLGGWLCAQYALRFPERMAELVPSRPSGHDLTIVQPDLVKLSTAPTSMPRSSSAVPSPPRSRSEIGRASCRE